LFNSAHNHQVNIDILNEISFKPTLDWGSFIKEEFKAAISKYSGLSASELDKISWKVLKRIINNNSYLTFIINITNACLSLGHWPLHFKVSISIIILKPNKISYNSPKSFQPIVLLNTLSKLIEKVIGEKMQFHSISNNFVYPSQLGGLKQYSITDTGFFLTHIVQLEWVKNILSSTLTFDIA